VVSEAAISARDITAPARNTRIRISCANKRKPAGFMIGGYDHQGIVVRICVGVCFFGKTLSDADRPVKLNGVPDGAVGVFPVRLLIDGSSFNHKKETARAR